jgi:hypothetical protein
MATAAGLLIRRQTAPAVWGGVTSSAIPSAPAVPVPLSQPRGVRVVFLRTGHVQSSSAPPPVAAMPVPLSQPPGLRVVFTPAGHVQSSPVTAASGPPPVPSLHPVLATFTSRWRWAAGGARNTP